MSPKMTFKELAQKHLDSKCLFPTTIKTIVEIAQNHSMMESMQNRWNEPLENYPDSFQQVFLTSLDYIAADWIDENEPQAWYRSMFPARKKKDETP